MTLQKDILSKEEKERILRTIEADREFRYALMGLLGFEELLKRFARLEERQQRLEERFARIEERFAKLEERQQKLEERFAKLEERQQRLEEEMRETRRVLIVVSHRFGVISEAGFREAMKYFVQEALGVGTVERWTYRDAEGFVYGYPSTIEVDVAIHDKTHILVEVKSRVSRGDVAELDRIRRLYEKVKGVRAKAVIIGGFVDPDALTAASRLGVEVRPIIRE